VGPQLPFDFAQGRLSTARQFHVSHGKPGVRRGRRGDKGHRFGARIGGRYLVFVRLLKHLFLDFHVSELVGVEYLTTIQTFDVFNVLFTRYHADFWVFAGGVHREI
jgi:hypothetical protein